MFAGLSYECVGQCLGRRACVAGWRRLFREVFPHEHEEPCRSCSKIIRITTERRVVVTRASCTRSRARMASPGDLPDIAGLKGGLAGG